MLKPKKFTHWMKFTPGKDRPKDERAKERERMAEALAAYHQMPAGELQGQGVVGVKSGGKGAVADRLESRRILRQLAQLRECPTAD